MHRVFLAAALASCTSSPGWVQPTHQITGHLDAELRDGTLSVALGLQENEVGDLLLNDPYALVPGESVHMTFRGESVPLVRGADADHFAIYSAALSPGTAVAGNEPIAATFDRGGGQHTTLTATATPDFTLDAPASSSAPVVVRWSPTATDLMHWQSSSPSVPDADGAIQVDSGQLAFPAGVLVAPTAHAAEAVVIDIARTRSSTPPSDFEDAVVTFNRWQTATVEVMP